MCDDLGAEVTIRDYMRELLFAIFGEGESFSGKRPFGNSGWERDIAKPLISAGLIPGALDEDGYIDDFDEDAYDRAITEMIHAL
jgi:hypothetical protein